MLLSSKPLEGGHGKALLHHNPKYKHLSFSHHSVPAFSDIMIAASNKCGRCVRENKNYKGGKPCVLMDLGHRSVCRRLETEIAKRYPDMVRFSVQFLGRLLIDSQAEVRGLQVLCRKLLQEYKGREKTQSEKGKSKARATAQEKTSTAASDSTSGVAPSRAQEIVSSQIMLDIANSLHSLSSTFAAMAVGFFFASFHFSFF